MGLKAAHEFIRHARRGGDIAAKIHAMGGDPNLAELAEIAREIGLFFDPELLRTAYAQEWALRAVADNGNGSSPRNRLSNSAASAT